MIERDSISGFEIILTFSFMHSLILIFFFSFLLHGTLFIETTNEHLSLLKTQAQPLEMCKIAGIYKL